MNAVQTAPEEVDWLNYHLREMEPKDSKAYSELMASSPDTGRITIQVIFKEDPYEMLMKRRIGQVVVVAETPEGQVVGAGSADAVARAGEERQALAVEHLPIGGLEVLQLLELECARIGRGEGLMRARDVVERG